MYSQTIIKDNVREINRKIDALIMAFGDMQVEFKRLVEEQNKLQYKMSQETKGSKGKR